MGCKQLEERDVQRLCDRVGFLLFIVHRSEDMAG